ncbi:response regulator [Eleftheria terrae]|uniref:response regulator n=1 Tax=Eleftheria terrae TaxID=1597781 RepID=UPI00263AE5B8|nr:response regulator [Eleftheria terrae]WKB53814.1 response regulator [Eleftheria terrae]
MNPAEGAPASGHPSPCKVLIADDNVDAAESLAVLLSLDGHEVRTARGGEEALQMAESFQPDAAVLDIGMPRLNGYEVARRIRAASWGGRMLLIALTGWSQSDDLQRARDAGFDHHCTKPANPDELQPWLKQAVERRSATH